jgi:hypothetical protein
MMPGGVAQPDLFFRRSLSKLIRRLRPMGKASGLDAGISARLCHTSHLGDDVEPEHVDLLFKLRRAESGPAIGVLDVSIDGPQALSALNQLDPMFTAAQVRNHEHNIG